MISKDDALEVYQTWKGLEDGKGPWRDLWMQVIAYMGIQYGTWDESTADEGKYYSRAPSVKLTDTTALDSSKILADGVAYRDEFKTQMTEFTGKMSAKGYVSYNNSSDDIHDEWVNCLMMRSWYRRFYAERIQSANGDRELWGSEASEMAEVIG